MPLFTKDDLKNELREELIASFNQDLLKNDEFLQQTPVHIADSVGGLLHRIRNREGALGKLLDLDKETKDTIVQSCLNFYDNVVAPFDIPMIPNVLEPMIDRKLRLLVEPAVRRVLDRFDRTEDQVATSVTATTMSSDLPIT
jgi:hypothetical protein